MKKNNAKEEKSGKSDNFRKNKPPMYFGEVPKIVADAKQGEGNDPSLGNVKKKGKSCESGKGKYP
ncbi:hypothetical protein [Leptospira interrogans]|uniref:hypothetical protein n=1 Tax=Leptospira interrogans TaxID=173 RepID=UPI0002BC645C|nr:hypothetical protein [Leptospira interrogans]KGE21800.1 hypothetical protein IQ65_21945 [Leptospira interrogans serovar Lai]MBM2890048.1 hypothetical protein [Leptospira interrogans]QOI36816.1 hypothetical protein LeptoLang_21765 [Leptospira interrogans serovar Icterohaemorrhagiae]